MATKNTKAGLTVRITADPEILEAIRNLTAAVELLLYQLPEPKDS